MLLFCLVLLVLLFCLFFISVVILPCFISVVILPCIITVVIFLKVMLFFGGEIWEGNCPVSRNCHILSVQVCNVSDYYFLTKML